MSTAVIETNIKMMLFQQLKKEHAFWSYDNKSVKLSRMSD